MKRIACNGHRGLYISAADDIYSFGDADEDEGGAEGGGSVLPGGGTMRDGLLGPSSGFSTGDSASQASELPSASSVARPRVVQEMVLERVLAGRRVVQVACGHQHSVALTLRGEVWSWGRGDHGRLGHGDSRD